MPDLGTTPGDRIGQLAIQAGAHPTYEDEDVLVAKNRRAIRCCHAEHVCHVKHVALNRDGLRVADSLPDMMRSHVYQYKCQRVSRTEINRITLATLDEELMFEIDLPGWIRKRLRHARHGIFGSTGREYWYDGRFNATHAALDKVWTEIEGRTASREVDHVHWPFTPAELRQVLTISVDDFDDTESGKLTAPLMDDSDPLDPVMVKKRKRHVNWRALQDVVGADVLDKEVSVDIRSVRKHIRATIVDTKTT